MSGPGIGEGTRADLERSLLTVRGRVAEACRRAGRDPGDVTIVAATKTVSVARIRWACELGIEHFGENFAKDLAVKAEAVSATWHFFGKLQRGTAARVADHADVVHSGEPGGGLERLARRVAASGRVVRMLVQVDFTGSRQGIDPADVGSFLEEASELPGLAWAGLMTLPPWTEVPESTRPYFARLREIRHGLQERWPDLRELSMGMSGDYEVAAEEGATMLRLGTALFGERPGGRPGAP